MNKAKLAFEMLEKEMEVIKKSDLESIIGGDGVGKITSGDGSISNPYVISATFFYGSELSSAMKTGIDNMIYGFNNAGIIEVNNCHYTFAFGGIMESNTSQAINHAGSSAVELGMSTAVIKQGALDPLTLGQAKSVMITIDELQTSMASASLIAVLRHEAGHLLGFNGGYDGQGHTGFATGLMAPEVYSGQPIDFTYDEYQNMILHGIIGSTGGAFDGIDPDSIGSTGVLSTVLNENNEFVENFFYYDFSDPQYEFTSQVQSMPGYSGYSTGYRNLSTNEIIADVDDLYLYTENSTGSSTGAESTGG